MQTKLQELTEKIYQEGVNQAKEESEKILAEAQKEADAIVNKAKKEAEELLSKAEKDAEEQKKNALNELQLSARQLISDTRQKLVGLIETKTIKPETKKAFEDAAFTRDMVLTLVKNWNPSKSESVDLNVLLPKDKKTEFEDYFKSKTGALLQDGLTIQYTDKLKAGLKIGPKDGGYMVSFSDEDFDNLFRAYLRPKLIEMLYSR